jgi:hypothetical protein
VQLERRQLDVDRRTRLQLRADLELRAEDTDRKSLVFGHIDSITALHLLGAQFMGIEGPINGVNIATRRFDGNDAETAFEIRADLTRELSVLIAFDTNPPFASGFDSDRRDDSTVDFRPAKSEPVAKN